MHFPLLAGRASFHNQMIAPQKTCDFIYDYRYRYLMEAACATALRSSSLSCAAQQTVTVALLLRPSL